MTRARELVATLGAEYDRAYYSGVVAERRARVLLDRGGPGRFLAAGDWLSEAMRMFERADAVKPVDQDDALLRWNACARLFHQYPELMRPATSASVRWCWNKKPTRGHGEVRRTGRVSDGAISMKRSLLLIALSGFLVSAVWSLSLSAQRPAVDDEALKAANSRAGEWITHGRTQDEQRFSPLEKISDLNVRQLRLAWTFEDRHRSRARGHAARGRRRDVHDRVVGHRLCPRCENRQSSYGSGIRKWIRRYERFACCDVVNRGVAFYKGRVYAAAFDGRLTALDAKSGEVVWSVVTVEHARAVPGAAGAARRAQLAADVVQPEDRTRVHSHARQRAGVSQPENFEFRPNQINLAAGNAGMDHAGD